MKKILLLGLGLAAAFSATAREYTFKLGETVIDNGSTIVYNDYTVSDFGDITYAPELTLTSDIFTNTTQLTAKSLTGQKVQVCAGGDCVIGTDIVKTMTMQSKKPVDLMLEYSDTSESIEQVPTVKVSVDVVDTKFPNTAKSFTIIFHGDASVGNTAVDGYDVKVADDALNYVVAQPSTLRVYNAGGQQVKTYVLTGKGQLTTADLPAGVYVYILDGKGIQINGKFVR